MSHSDIESIFYAFSALLSVSSIVFLLLGLRFRRTSLNEKCHNKKYYSRVNNIIESTDELLTRKLTPNETLTHSAAEIGIGNIEYLLKNILTSENSKPYLFGINKGGALIANYLSHRMALHEKFLVKCDYRPDIDKIYCEKRDISGPIVIIDDVTRSGTTLFKVKEHIKSVYPDNPIYCFVLVVVDSNLNGDTITNLVDYAPWITENKTISLPWSGTTSENIKIDDYFDDTEMDQIIGRIKNLDAA
ncbi:phosphoribosyltransferase [Hahella sp. CR1]|uniref:phosphoribosyltransferase n=1 Tax=Hahella sp. CR1 TaxID=2992807 RepID=UPI00244297F2|nr:phosphoribosyltransferase [Hahella sp. CR1]MDG9667696.1 phosphoribosyltransferase [Hahella sp. CR1]